MKNETPPCAEEGGAERSPGRGKYGRLAERSKAAVLKTVDVQASGGPNPSPSARICGKYRVKSRKEQTLRLFEDFFVEVYINGDPDL